MIFGNKNEGYKEGFLTVVFGKINMKVKTEIFWRNLELYMKVKI